MALPKSNLYSMQPIIVLLLSNASPDYLKLRRLTTVGKLKSIDVDYEASDLLFDSPCALLKIPKRLYTLHVTVEISQPLNREDKDKLDVNFPNPPLSYRGIILVQVFGVYAVSITQSFGIMMWRKRAGSHKNFIFHLSSRSAYIVGCSLLPALPP